MNNITGKFSECCDDQQTDFTNITSDTINNSGLITTNDVKVNLNTNTRTINNTLDIKTDSLNSNTINNSGVIDTNSLICTLDVKTDVLTSSTITNTNTINTNSIKSKNNFYITAFNNDLYNNFINYTTNINIFQTIIPLQSTIYHHLQNVVNPGQRTLSYIQNNDIQIGTKFNLKLGMQIVDTQNASGKNYIFALFINTDYIEIGTTPPPKNLTFTYINVNCDIVCSAKANGLYSFVVSSQFSFSNDNNGVNDTFIYSNQMVNIVEDINNVIEIKYRELNGNNTQVLFNRGVYQLFKF